MPPSPTSCWILADTSKKLVGAPFNSWWEQNDDEGEEKEDDEENKNKKDDMRTTEIQQSERGEALIRL